MTSIEPESWPKNRAERECMQEGREARRELQSVTVLTSAQALIAMTAAQKQTLADRLERYTLWPERGCKLTTLTVFYGGLGLPEGYLSVSFEFEDGDHLHGGIDPEGRMST